MSKDKNPVIHDLTQLSGQLATQSQQSSQQSQQSQQLSQQSSNLTSVGMTPTQNFSSQSSGDSNHNPRGSERRVGFEDDNLQNNGLEAIQSVFRSKWDQYKFMHQDNIELGRKLTPEARLKFRREVQDLFINSKIFNGTISQYAADVNAGNWADFDKQENYFKKLDEANLMIQGSRSSAREQMRRMDRMERKDDGSDDRDRDRSEANPIIRNPRNDRLSAADREQVCDWWIYKQSLSYVPLANRS